MQILDSGTEKKKKALVLAFCCDHLEVERIEKRHKQKNIGPEIVSTRKLMQTWRVRVKTPVRKWGQYIL